MLIRRLRYLVGRRRHEAELAEELQFHRAQVEQDLEQRGLAGDETTFAAQRALGNDLLARERSRDVWIAPRLQDAVLDVRFAARLLTRERGFAFVAVIALGLGIGVATTQFAIVNAICLRGLPIDRPDRLVYVSSRDARDNEAGISWRDFQDYGASARTLSGVAAFTETPAAIGDEGRAPDRVIRAYVSANTFDFLGIRPLIGRGFEAVDDRLGAAPVVLLGFDLWKTRYASDPGIVGRPVRINDASAVVVGVMPATFAFPGRADLWQPLATMPGLDGSRYARTLGMIGRLATGAHVVDARAELAAATSRLSREHPDTSAGVTVSVVPINDRYNGNVTDAVWIAFIMVGVLVVLIACANVANLLLMRATHRQGEIAVRAALGAGRRRIVRQLLVESALLAAAGGVVGLGFSFLGLRALETMIPEEGLPYWVRFTVDARVLLLVVLVSIGTVIVFGLAPALHLSSTNVHDALRSGRRMAGSIRVRRLTGALLTFEFALTVILVAAVVLGVRTDRAAARAEVRIDTSGLLTMWLTLPDDMYATADERMALYDRLTERLAGVDSVASSSLASALPFRGASARQLAIDGQPLTGDRPPTVWAVAVDARYFETLGVPVIRGRDLTSRDGTTGHGAAIINARFAQLYFGAGDPLGRRIRLIDESHHEAPWLTIVGVSPTIRQRPGPEPDPIVYVPLRSAPPATLAVMVRSPSDTAAVAPVLREQLRALDPRLPLYRIMTMEQFIRESGWNGRASAAILDVIAAIALLLASVGLYAVTAYAVAMRTQEIGVRMALGAGRLRVARLVLRRVLGHLAIGFGCGIAVTWIWGRAIGGGAGSAPGLTDPVTLSCVALVLLVTGLLAVVAPVRNATRLQPVQALRHE